MSNETDEIEMIFADIRALSDELGLETRPYVEVDLDESRLSDFARKPRSRVRGKVAGGLAAFAVAATAVTVLTLGNGGSERPDPEALSATLAAPSAVPLEGYRAQLDSNFSGQLSAQADQLERTAGKAQSLATLDEIVAASTRVVVTEADSPPVAEPSPGLRPGLAFTGRLVYFLLDGPGGSSSIVPPYAETSPGLFVATAPTGDQVRRFTAEQLDAIGKR